MNKFGLIGGCAMVALAASLVACGDKPAEIATLNVPDAPESATTAAATEAAPDTLISPRRSNGLYRYHNLESWTGNVSYVDFLEVVNNIDGAMSADGFDPEGSVMCYASVGDGYLWASPMSAQREVYYRIKVDPSKQEGQRVTLERSSEHPNFPEIANMGY